MSVSGMYMDPSGRLWITGGNDGIITAMPNDATDSSTNPPVWTNSSVGIEEMVSMWGILPQGGKPVFSFEDETLFTIDDPDTETAQHFPIVLWDNGNNGLSSGQDINYAPNQPLYMVQDANNSLAGTPTNRSSQFSGYSADGGATWNLFQSIVAGTHPCILYDGIIAVSARASGHVNDPPGSDNIVWIPTNYNNFSYFAEGPAPFYSKDGGATWYQTASFNSTPGAFTLTPCSGQPTYTYMPFQWGDWDISLKQHNLIADPITPGTFYVHLTAGGFWKSTDGGVTWTQTAGNGEVAQYTHHGVLAANPGASGDIWVVDGHEGATAHGLYHTLDGGNSFSRSPLFDYAWEVALGKAATAAPYPAIYVYGRYTGDPNWGIFQSTDGGNTFNRVSYYPYGLLDVPSSMAASWDTFGTIYVGFGGNSVAYAEYYPPNVAIAPPSITPGGGSLLASYDASVNVVLASTTPSAIIMYTLDGSTPTATHGTVYSGPFTLTATATLQKITVKAVAFADTRNSAVSSANYQIQLGLAKGQAETAPPTFSSAGGVVTTTQGGFVVTTAQTVTIASATPNASIRYTTNGTLPTATTGTLYTGQVSVTGNTTINAIAYKTGYVPSAVTTAQWQFAVVPQN
jgi:hypothetical protein